MVSYIIGEAINNDEYVPTIIPTIRANIKPLIDSPPKMKMANNTNKVASEVINVLLKVLLNDTSTNFWKFQLVCSLIYSLTLSNTITVSFSEYPTTVKIAAINAWSISMLKGINL